MPILLFLLNLLFSGEASAQIPETSWAQTLVSVKPLPYIKDGKVLGCGLRFTGVNAEEKSIDATLNNFIYNEQLQTLFKVAAFESKKGKTENISLKKGWFKSGNISSSEFTPSRADDKYNFIAGINDNPEMVVNLTKSIEARGILLGYSTKGSDFDTLFEIKPQQIPKESINLYLKCLVEMVKK